MMEKKLRIGIVGTGLIARYHATAIHACNDSCEITAICDLDPEKMDKYAIDMNLNASKFLDYKDLINSGLIDMVSVTTANDSHKEITIYAASKKIPVLCEKPLGLNVQEVLEMADACEKYNVQNLTGFTYRRIPAIAKIKNFIDKGNLGRIYHIKGRFYADRMASASHPLEWRHLEEKAGSGVLGDLASHTLDMTLYMMENQCSKISKIYGQSGIFIPFRKDTQTGKDVPVTTDDYCNVLASFEDGTNVCLENSRHSPFDMEMHISGEKGSIKFSLTKQDEFELMLYDSPCDYFKTYKTIPVTVGEKESQDRMVRQYLYFTDCLVNKKEAHPSIRETVYIQEILDKAKESYKTEKLLQL